MTNVAVRVLSRYAPGLASRWREPHESRTQPHASGTKKHGQRSGAVHGSPYAPRHKPRYEMGSALGRYGHRIAAGVHRPSWKETHGPGRKKTSHKLHGLERRAKMRLERRKQALRKRARSSVSLKKQALVRAVARSMLAISGWGRALGSVMRKLRARSGRAVEPHTPLGRRERQTSLRAEGGKQTAFKWAEPEARAASPTPVTFETETEQAGRSAPRHGYISPDAQLAANELHFDQSNARAIHGAISSASRHAQGKRDHRGGN